ncbi:CHAT domain-containing protein [Mycena rosella]|uniref:CHAT domain-containing protein n=1 Tax=Mycena rosella TaxID=1033263 RepID=A0AAD7DCS0_MYCRO|nr:CHAT domain-containing protein [Mycena rosella]
MSYSHQYDKHNDPKDLDAAIKNKTAAIELTHRQHPERAARLQSLAVSLTYRFRRLEDPQDINAAVRNLQQAVELTPEGHPEFHQRLEGLAVTFSHRYERLRDLRDLDSALNYGQAAILSAPDGYPDLPARLQDLAMSFSDRYNQLGNPEDLESSLQQSTQALMLMPIGHPERPGHMESVSTVLISRYERWGDPDDLNSAVQHDQAAVELTDPGHADYTRRLHQLALALGRRYNRAGDVADLDAALRHIEFAVGLTRKGHPGLPGYLTTLGRFYQRRYRKLGYSTDIDAALKCSQKAVELTVDDHPSLGERLHSWGVAFGARYEKLNNIEDLESSLEKYQAAVNLTPVDPDLPGRLHSLALALEQRYTRLGDTQDLEKVFKTYREAFSIPTSAPVQSWKAALRWASFAKKHRPRDQQEAYLAAFKLLPEILWMGNTLAVHQDANRRLDIAKATAGAVRAGVALGNIPFAIELLEQGLATTFQRLLQLKTDIKELPEDKANELQMISAKLYSGTSKNPQQLAVERNKLLDKIRGLPGLQSFLLPQKYRELCQATQNGPVIILNSHRARHDVLLLLNPASHPVHIPLRSFNFDELEAQRNHLKEILARCNITARQPESTRLDGEREGADSRPTQESFRDLLAWLWSHIVEPVYEVLKLHGIRDGRLWWCPTGAFTGLPLHAAAPSDHFIQSYTSTLGALIDANSKKPVRGRPKIGAVGVTYSGRGREAELPSVAREIATILSVIGKDNVHSLLGEQATVQAVTSQLQDCSWLHLACHGRQNLADPPKSCLQLYGGNLELETILRMPLPKAELVFLAACQTAMGDAELVNESFHLAGGFIAAGFRGAIATAWSMCDSDGPLVAEAVYTHLFRNGQIPAATDAAEALQIAVRNMRDSGIPYERWVPFIHLGV